VAVVFAFYELWTHFAGFRDFWESAWHDIMAVVDTAVSFIKSHWQILATALATLLLGPIAGLAVLIATHLNDVKRAFDDAWGAIKAGVSDVVDFITDHWKLILAIVLGVAGLIIDALVTHWKAVEDGFKTAYDFVEDVVRTVLSAIETLIRPFVSAAEDLFKACWSAVSAATTAAWDAIKTAVSVGLSAVKTVLSWFSDLASLFQGWWNRAVSAVKTQITDMINVVKEIPGWINNALGGLPDMLFKAGVNAIKGLISGIESMVGSLGSTMSSIASKVAGFFGLSPAREGPLSGSGSPYIRGLHFAQDIAQGIIDGSRAMSYAANAAALAAAMPRLTLPTYGGSYGSSGGASSATASSTPGGSPGGNLIVNVDGRTLFSIAQSQLYQYNVRNSGQVTGVVKPA